MAYDRRTFIKTGAVLAAGAVAGCAGSSRADAVKSSADALLSGAVRSGDVPGVVASAATKPKSEARERYS